MSFIAVVLFASVHLFATRAKKLCWSLQRRFFSFGGGVAISYVFINLLPKLGKNNLFVQKTLEGVFPYFERHVFVMALLGFLLFYSLDRAPAAARKKRKFWISIASYALFNFLVGYAISDENDPEVQPVALFTFAMALHYFTNDYSLSDSYGKEYTKKGKWVLILSLFIGWFVGLATDLPDVAVALVSAFIGGGVIMNVIRHELPKQKPNSLSTFLLATAGYTALLLALHA